MFRQAKTRKINRNFQIQHMSGFIIQNPMKHGTCLENLDTIMVYYGFYGSLWFIERKLKGNMEDLWTSGRYNGLPGEPCEDW